MSVTHKAHRAPKTPTLTEAQAAIPGASDQYVVWLAAHNKVNKLEEIVGRLKKMSHAGGGCAKSAFARNNAELMVARAQLDKETTKMNAIINPKKD